MKRYWVCILLWALWGCDEKAHGPELILEDFIRSLPRKERAVFQNYRRVWILLAEEFAKGDLPEHKDFKEKLGYEMEQEQWLLRHLLTKDSLWNPYAIQCIDTLILFFQSQTKEAICSGMTLKYHKAEKDSGDRLFTRFYGLTQFTPTHHFVKKEWFSKFVHEVYPLPLSLDFSLPKRAKSFFCVDYENIREIDSVYNELYAKHLQTFYTYENNLMDTSTFLSYRTEKIRTKLLQEFYRIVNLQQSIDMPEEDWQHALIRPVIDALILFLAKKDFLKQDFEPSLTGISPELRYYGLMTLANQWTNSSPWLHHYINSGLQALATELDDSAYIFLRLPIGKESIRRKSTADPTLIAPVMLNFVYPKKFYEQFWLSIRIHNNPKEPVIRVLKHQKFNF